MTQFFDPKQHNWKSQQHIPHESFICGFCSHRVASDRGYGIHLHSDASGELVGGVWICPNCQGPTFFAIGGDQYPGPLVGRSVEGVPDDLNALFQEARRCTGVSAYTSSVLVCRKMLMNIAVAQRAPQGQRFLEYVEFLSEKGFIPPNGKHWVDHIRKRGNEATHEITVMTQKDAVELLTFTEMLLRFIFEFPKMVPIDAKT